MEQQFAETQQALSELQEKLAEKDVQIAMYEQDLSSVNEHSTVGARLGCRGGRPRSTRWGASRGPTGGGAWSACWATLHLTLWPLTLPCPLHAAAGATQSRRPAAAGGLPPGPVGDPRGCMAILLCSVPEVGRHVPLA